MDIDAGRGRHFLAHGLAHHVVVVGIQVSSPPVGYHLIDACHVVGVVMNSFIDDFAVFNKMAETEIGVIHELQIVISQSIACTLSIETNAFNDIILIHIFL